MPEVPGDPISERKLIPDYIDLRKEQLNAWEQKIGSEKVSDTRLIGELIAQGANLKSYAGGKKEAWKPQVHRVGGGATRVREMVTFAEGGLMAAGPRWGLETLRTGLNHAVKIEGSQTFGSEKLLMVPYLRFGVNGEVNPLRTEILLLSTSQVDSLGPILRLKT